MPTEKLNGVDLYYEIEGEGPPLVLVHGSWSNAKRWEPLVAPLAQEFQVISYDRRSHSRSERPEGPRTRTEDEDDLAAVIERFAGGSAPVVGNSFGGLTALGLAARRPEVLGALTAHEPPAAALAPDAAGEAAGHIQAVVQEIQAGESESGARRFVENVALGPGGWEMLPEDIRGDFVENAPAFAAEQMDPHSAELDLEALAAYPGPMLVTKGTMSPPWFHAVVDRIVAAVPHARAATIEGAGHVPHLTHADEYAKLVSEFVHSGATA
jgi:pimeloyl-ACP methyl ester carboxylesterase